MRSLSRAVQRSDSYGSRLRLPWYDLEKYVTLYTRQLVMLAGGPGGGKSTIAVNLAMAVDAPVLYIAQDSEQSVISRMAAIGLGIDVADAADRMQKERTRLEMGSALAEIRPSLVIATGAHTVELIEERILALTEWLGHAPRMVILDNLIDTLAPGFHYNDPGFYSYLLPQLKQQAQDLDTCMIVLHHVRRSSDSGSIGTGSRPMRMDDLLYAGERETRHVWGVYHRDKHHMKVQVLKQTDGPADPDGALEVELLWYPEQGQVRNG